jgi:F-type H+-transporting ATPase subunit delta
MVVAVMRGMSRESLAAGRERLEALLAPAGGLRDTAQLQGLGDELFAVTTLLSGNAGLRRALTDPARDGAAKAGLVQRVLGGKVSDGALDLVAGLARSRWSQPTDLVDAVESMAVDAVLAAAERAGRLDTVEDELFRFSRVVSADQGLRDAFSGRTAGAVRKEDLVTTLLQGRAAPETVRLAVQAASHPRGLRTEQVLEAYVDVAARRREQVVADVVAALPLDETQRRRLGAALQRQYGRPVRLNVDVDPEVLGGLRVQVRGEVVDGTVAARLDEARRGLTG